MATFANVFQMALKTTVSVSFRDEDKIQDHCKVAVFRFMGYKKINMVSYLVSTSMASLASPYLHTYKH